MIRGIIPAAMILVVGCQNTDSIPPSYKIFFDMKSAHRLTAYSKYSLKEQYEIMQIGNSIVHPPMIELVDKFADNGPVVIPILKDQLEQSHDDTTIRNIAFTLLLLDKKRLYDSSKDSLLIRDLVKKNDQFSGTWSDETRNMLEQLEETEAGRAL